MAQKIINLDGIGEITIAKRRGARNIRVSVGANGKIRVGMPAWLPYQAGVEFARSHRSWILQRLAERPKVVLRNDMAIGKSFRLYFKITEGSSRTTTRLFANEIVVFSHQPIESPSVQKAARGAIERALHKEAGVLLPQRLKQLAGRYGYSYRAVRVRKLTSRWGSCSSQQVISLSYLLIQLPWHLIDYVMVHELVHTEHMNHGPDFWEAFLAALPDAKARRKEIRKLHPQLLVA